MAHDIPNEGNVTIGRAMLDCIIYDNLTSETLIYTTKRGGPRVRKTTFLRNVVHADHVELWAEVNSEDEDIPIRIVLPLDKDECVGDYVIELRTEGPPPDLVVA